MKKELYIVAAEVRGLENSLLRSETDEIGAFLYVFLLSRDALDAANKAKNALQSDSYEVIKIEEIILAEHFEFVDDPETDYDALKQEAKETGNVVYGPFFTYEDE